MNAQESQLDALIGIGALDEFPDKIFQQLKQRLPGLLGSTDFESLELTQDGMRQIVWESIKKKFAPYVEEGSLHDYLHGAPSTPESSSDGELPASEGKSSRQASEAPEHGVNPPKP